MVILMVARIYIDHSLERVGRCLLLISIFISSSVGFGDLIFHLFMNAIYSFQMNAKKKEYSNMTNTRPSQWLIVLVKPELGCIDYYYRFGLKISLEMNIQLAGQTVAMFGIHQT